MSGGVDATQLLDPASWCAIVTWLGLVLLGIAILMTLLDWGELSGMATGPPPRRRWARLLGIAGALLIVLGVAGALVLG
jgi:hypothetical protein